jgi:hypothetical protein
MLITLLTAAAITTATPSISPGPPIVSDPSPCVIIPHYCDDQIVPTTPSSTTPTQKTPAPTSAVPTQAVPTPAPRTTTRPKPVHPHQQSTDEKLRSEIQLYADLIHNLFTHSHISGKMRAV